MLGKQMGHDPRSSARTPGTETRLASVTADDDASRSTARAAEEPQRDAGPKQDDKAESTAQFAEGPGSEAVPPSSTSSYAGPTEDPDATSADAGSHDNDAPTTTVRSEPFSKPEPVKIEAPKPAKAAVEAPTEQEPPKRSERPKRDDTEQSSRHRDADRKVTRDAEREPESHRTVRIHRAEETSHDTKSDRRDESAPVREERKPSRERVTDEPKRGRTRDQDGERASVRTVTVKKSEKVEKTETAKAPDTKSDADAERAAEDAKLYRVRVGRVHPREEAEKLRDELKDATGVDAFLVPVGDGFQIQTGAYKRKANADKIAATLRAGNFKTVVRQDP